jgi:hypothetical protein
MDIEIFALCDAATDYGGKLSLLGTFDTLATRQFPTLHPHCAIALRARFERPEAGEHPFRITIVDADGKPVAPAVDGTLGVTCPPHVSSIAANMVLNITGLKLDRPGRYSVNLAIDNRHEKSLPLTVMQVEPKPPAKD